MGEEWKQRNQLEVNYKIKVRIENDLDEDGKKLLKFGYILKQS